MTNTATNTTDTAATTTTAVDRLLHRITTPGPPPADVYAHDAVLDAVVPGWRYAVRGSQSIGYQVAEWYQHPGVLEELTRRPTADGEVIEYTVAWEEDGVPHAARHVHVLVVDRAADRITTDHFWCGGRWDAPLLAQMEAARDDG